MIRWLCIIRNFFLRGILRQSFTDSFNELFDELWLMVRLGIYVDEIAIWLHEQVIQEVGFSYIGDYFGPKKPTLWKVLITFFHSLSTLCLLILQSNVSLSSWCNPKFFLLTSLARRDWIYMSEYTYANMQTHKFLLCRNCQWLHRRGIQFLFCHFSSLKNSNYFLQCLMICSIVIGTYVSANESASVNICSIFDG